MPEDTLLPDEPREIGPYHILQKLGEGGMGDVWEAEQTEPVRRRVALKIIKLGMDTHQVIARFEAERQALAVMDHPGIAKVFDAGATEAGRPYFVMELVKGMPLHAYCDTHKLSTDERLRLFIQVCNAVQHAHQKGVIHRDLKPSNVLVTVQDGVAMPKVIDFGVAKAMGQDLTDRTLITQLGHFVGTPKYVSPEQAEMSPLGVDTRTDIYSMGVMLYELLVGTPPIDLVGVAWAAMSAVIREQEPQTPSSRIMTLPDNSRESVARFRQTDPAALRRVLKGDLDFVVMKCLEKDRTRRYETANALAMDLRRHLRHEPVLAQPPSAAYRFRKFVRRHRIGVAFATVLALLITALAVSMSVQAARIAQERDRTAREAAKAAAVRDFMTRILAAPNPLNALGPDATILEAVDNAVAQADNGFADEPEVDAAIRHEIGRVYLRLGQYEAARPLLEGALRVRLEAIGEQNADVGETLGLLADLAQVFSQLDSADALYARGVDLIGRFGDPDDPRLDDLRLRHAGLLTATGRYAEAEAMLLESLDRSRAIGPDNPSAATAASRLSILYWTTGDLERAEQYARDALAQRERTLPDDHALLAESLHNLAMVTDDRGDKQTAAQFYARALAIYENIFGAESEYVAITLNNLALVQVDLGNDGEAEALYRRALAIDLRLFGEEHIGPAIDRVNLGRHLCSTGQADEGTEMARTAVRTLESLLEPDQFEVALAHSTYGLCLGTLGRFAEGERELLDAIGRVERTMGADHSRLATLRNRLADLYDAWGRPDRAAEYRS